MLEHINTIVCDRCKKAELKDGSLTDLYKYVCLQGWLKIGDNFYCYVCVHNHMLKEKFTNLYSLRKV